MNKKFLEGLKVGGGLLGAMIVSGFPLWGIALMMLDEKYHWSPPTPYERQLMVAEYGWELDHPCPFDETRAACLDDRRFTIERWFSAEAPQAR